MQIHLHLNRRFIPQSESSQFFLKKQRSNFCILGQLWDGNGASIKPQTIISQHIDL